jgi:hypothetical protein
MEANEHGLREGMGSGEGFHIYYLHAFAPTTFKTHLAQVAAPRARVQMFDRATTALAQSSQMALSHLKRLE